MSEGAQTSRLAVLMFTDVTGSVELKARLGTMTYARLLARHDDLFKRLLADYPSAEVLQDMGDAYFTAFGTVSDAVRLALRFQEAISREPWDPEPLRTRIGIHFGELVESGPRQQNLSRRRQRHQPRRDVDCHADELLRRLGRRNQLPGDGI